MSATTEERVRILKMVADATITPAEADDLLSALDPVTPTQNPAFGSNQAPVSELRAPGGVQRSFNGMTITAPVRSSRSLVLFISEDGETKVNIRLPLSLARTAGRMIPRRAQEYLNDYDIHLDRMFEDIGSLNLEGPLIEIQDEDTQIRIGIE
jgi:hypothetical protein